MKKESLIYIAGHRGLLGSAVVRNLKKNGYHNLLFRTSKELNLMDESSTFSFLERHKPEYMFICAAKVGGIQANIDSPAEFLYTNLKIQNNLIEGARRVNIKKTLFVGSSCIYPKKATCPIKENSIMSGPLESTNEGYAYAKLTGLKLGELYRKQYGLDFISAMPTNLYGINDHYNLRTSHLLPALILKIYNAKIENKKSVILWGTGKPRREFMLSDDCAAALVFLMKNYSSSEIINIGTGIDHSIIELANIVAQVLKADIEFLFDSNAPDGMLKKNLDITKLTNLGFKPQYSLEEGIEIAYQDFLKRN